MIFKLFCLEVEYFGQLPEIMYSCHDYESYPLNFPDVKVSSSFVPGWLAIARAFTEPELMELQSLKDNRLLLPWNKSLHFPSLERFMLSFILQDFVRQDGGSASGYVERLAAQLV